MSESQRAHASEKTKKSGPSKIEKIGSCTTCAHLPPGNAALTLQHALVAPRSLRVGDILQLQRTMGNQGVARMFGDVVQRQSPEDELVQGKFETVQRQAPEDDELLQGKFETTQRQEDEELLQGQFITSPPIQLKEGSLPQPNKTGMSDQLKTGLENLSRLDMSAVRVHYNSPKPAQLSALAYTQGTDIHVAPGQERHLPHEGWHAVQQMQGRVQPILQMEGTAINDDSGLEKEADVMGGKALQMQVGACQECGSDNHSPAKVPGKDSGKTQQESTADLTPFRPLSRLSLLKI